MNIFSKFIFEKGKFKLILVFYEILIGLYANMNDQLFTNIIDIKKKILDILILLLTQMVH